MLRKILLCRIFRALITFVKCIKNDNCFFFLLIQHKKETIHLLSTNILIYIFYKFRTRGFIFRVTVVFRILVWYSVFYMQQCNQSGRCMRGYVHRTVSTERTALLYHACMYNRLLAGESLGFKHAEDTNRSIILEKMHFVLFSKIILQCVVQKHKKIYFEFDS